ncbi:MAG: ribose 5-phosphate isomerase A [Caldilineaceae bacterium]|nr:ribose 5-phosphate isomerase A [Caldilineaceae bacterium]
MTAEQLATQKRNAAHHAATYVKPGMVVGLGSGSTAVLFVERLAALIRAGSLRDIVCVPTSSLIETLARQHKIPLASLEDRPDVHLTVDGADEVDPQLNLIKGGGGALLREKIVAQASAREVIIIDETKLSPLLGTKWHVPVEVVTFGWRTQFEYLSSLGAEVNLRETESGMPFVSDQGNYILDANFGTIENPAALAAKLKARVGIIEHGIFVGLAQEVIVGTHEGVRVMSIAARE